MSGLGRFSVYSGFGLGRFSVYSGFGLDRFSVYSGFGLDRFSVYSGFGLDRFHCILIIKNTAKNKNQEDVNKMYLQQMYKKIHIQCM